MSKDKKEKNEIFSKSSTGPKSIKALRDHKFYFDGIVYDLKEGETYEMPRILLDNLKTEKVIK